ncbi:MAG: hypothetical protein P4L50_16730 [Anaerolineaceae bacterium]|nr:hypothetical protein [Anaerolineaceae bacterium]
MDFFVNLFGQPPCPADRRQEVDKLINELVMIGKEDDFLSERPGGKFNLQYRHVRAREIGKRLSEIGRYPLMEYALKRVKKKLGASLSAHLEYAWDDISSQAA